MENDVNLNRVNDLKMYNEGAAESMFQSVGGCTNFDFFYQCIKL